VIVLGRTLRDCRAALEYPFWICRGRPAPDNHLHKRRRLLELGREYGCQTLIETGTFFGQTVNALRKCFDVVLSVELDKGFYETNRRAFLPCRNVRIYFGSSGERLGEMITASRGRIIFWLDGHFSGEGTGMGSSVSPILSELEEVRAANRKGDCIVIDDRRLFTGFAGYPEFREVERRLLEIDPDYQIEEEGDSIVALPRKGTTARQ
jgi:hypothetical protein